MASDTEVLRRIQYILERETDPWYAALQIKREIIDRLIETERDRWLRLMFTKKEKPV